jgi:hypothetical protein
LVEGAAGLEGCCIATVLGFQEFSWAWASAGADLKKLKLNMVMSLGRDERLVCSE